MRAIHKYKIYNKISNIPSYPTRILKFKRTKWLRIKKGILRKQRRRFRISFLNKELIKLNVGRWINMKNVYRHYMLNKRLSLVNLNLDRRLQTKLLKVKSSARFYNQIGRVDHALFLNKFFSSVFLAKQQIRSKKVLVNNLSLKGPILLKKGDFIVLKDTSFQFNNINKKISKSYSFNSHIEVDYYLQAFTILKSDKDLTNQDYFTIKGA